MVDANAGATLAEELTNSTVWGLWDFSGEVSHLQINLLLAALQYQF